MAKLIRLFLTTVAVIATVIFLVFVVQKGGAKNILVDAWNNNTQHKFSCADQEIQKLVETLVRQNFGAFMIRFGNQADKDSPDAVKYFAMIMQSPNISTAKMTMNQIVINEHDASTAKSECRANINIKTDGIDDAITYTVSYSIQPSLDQPSNVVVTMRRFAP